MAFFFLTSIFFSLLHSILDFYVIRISQKPSVEVHFPRMERRLWGQWSLRPAYAQSLGRSDMYVVPYYRDLAYLGDLHFLFYSRNITQVASRQPSCHTNTNPVPQLFVRCKHTPDQAQPCASAYNASILAKLSINSPSSSSLVAETAASPSSAAQSEICKK